MFRKSQDVQDESSGALCWKVSARTLSLVIGHQSQGKIIRDMSYVAFIIIPSRIFKSQQRLDEYQAFFETDLTNLALQRDIAMGIKSIAARIQMVEKNKAAVEKVLADY